MSGPDRPRPPHPYTPGHPDLLAPPPAAAPAAVPLVPGLVRLLLVLVALALAGYGAAGVLADDLYLPAKRAPGTHYLGPAALLLAGMLGCWAAGLAALAWARFDPVRRALSNGRLLATLCTGGIVLMVAGLVAHGGAI
ncbi:hypothetical protein [Massilia sp. YMA4]|uniref:hypothetical protein n=1 Tax=Massilia sp. YMA4 TaxID=1593482 RepID=UPI000DD10D4E|nr:hypothetical protein [Massilia sp. YMA4]AXA90723.1 hypothetical protein DPH57_05760 [Massilia sp. YMA4]